jgi:predicted naringenin-chalcone synthase
MGWRMGDHGFVMSLSARVPNLLRDHVAGWVDGWLADNGLERGAVASWAVHPGGPRIVEGVRTALGLEPERVAESMSVLRTHGNMSSPTILFIIRRMLEQGGALPMAALAFGPGLAGEVMLLDEPR